VRLTLNLIASVFVALVAAACVRLFNHPHQVDFLSFWRTAQDGPIYAAGQITFAYPPPFLFFIAPLGLMPFAPAFTVWVAGTGLIYFLCAGRSFAHPCVLPNGFVGQTGFLTAAIFLGGFRLLSGNPLLGGAVLGLLVIKPHLAVLIPLALVAGGHWRAFCAAAASSLSLAALALLVFGSGAYRGFLGVVPQYSAWVSDGRWPWSQIASPFAFARYFGAPEPFAFALQLTIACVAAALVWRAWRHDDEEKVPVLAAASVLVSPYLFGYDCLLLAAPFLWLVKHSPRTAVVVWFLALLPVLGTFGLYFGPNTLPIAAIVSLLGIHKLRGGSGRNQSRFINGGLDQRNELVGFGLCSESHGHDGFSSRAHLCP